MPLSSIKSRLSPVLFALSISALTTFSAQATIVEFQTSHGNFKVNLHDETTPKTVENFLKYVTDEDYNNTVIHRSMDDFVIQGGGYSFDGQIPLSAIATDSAVINEPVYSNVRGTIAMAKVPGNINSATSQWFINLSDNSSTQSLDSKEGGYTVFGEVTFDDEESLITIDKVSALSTCVMGGHTNVPVTDNSSTVCGSPSTEHFVTINSVTIYDATVKTDANLASIKNTLINQQPDVIDNSSSSGGGSLAWYSLALLGLISAARKLKSK